MIDIKIGAPLFILLAATITLNLVVVAIVDHSSRIARQIERNTGDKTGALETTGKVVMPRFVSRWRRQSSIPT
jgi:hypothetical protein